MDIGILEHLMQGIYKKGHINDNITNYCIHQSNNACGAVQYGKIIL